MAHTLGRRMLYPGSVYLLQKALMPVLLQGQARLVEEVRLPPAACPVLLGVWPPAPHDLVSASPLLSVMGAGQNYWPVMVTRLTPCLWTGEGRLSPRGRSW